MTGPETYFAIAAYGKDITPAQRLARACNRAERRPEIVRPFVVVANDETAAETPLIGGVASITGDARVPRHEFRFLTTAVQP